MYRIAAPQGVKPIAGFIIISDDILQDTDGTRVLGWFALIGHEIRCGGARLVAVFNEAGEARQVLILETEGVARYSALDENSDAISNVVCHFDALGLLQYFSCDAVRIDDGPVITDPRTGAVIC